MGGQLSDVDGAVAGIEARGRGKGQGRMVMGVRVECGAMGGGEEEVEGMPHFVPQGSDKERRGERLIQ